VLTTENAPVVAAICARLDGLPLAIELAAARCKLFTLPALIERLRRPDGAGALSVLVNGPHDLLAHQRTLRGTLDWSFELLSQEEQAVLMRLAVFAGGCDIEAAEAVASESKRQKVKGKRVEGDTSFLPLTFNLLPLLESLLDKSLVDQ